MEHVRNSQIGWNPCGQPLRKTRARETRRAFRGTVAIGRRRISGPDAGFGLLENHGVSRTRRRLCGFANMRDGRGIFGSPESTRCPPGRHEVRLAGQFYADLVTTLELFDQKVRKIAAVS